MTYCDLCVAEQLRRKKIVSQTRAMIYAHLQIQEEDSTSLMSSYCGYYLQISFSELHPLMVICLAKAMPYPSSGKQRQMANELNLKSILGSHAINDEVGCYSYRATQWLDNEMEAPRFFEILDRCVDEASRGYHKLAV